LTAASFCTLTGDSVKALHLPPEAFAQAEPAPVEQEVRIDPRSGAMDTSDAPDFRLRSTSSCFSSWYASKDQKQKPQSLFDCGFMWDFMWDKFRESS